jgi:branched-chain amino acid transport system permease protein
MDQVLVLGVIAGAIYGLFAIGIVLVYRGTGAVNFAQGEIGTASLFVAWWTITEHGWPWVPGAVVTVASAAAIGLAFERLVVRRMVHADRVTVAVATIGLLSFLLSMELRWFSPSPRIVPPPLQGLGWRIGGVYVSPTQFLAVGLCLAMSAVFTLLLRRTDFGLGVLAAAQDPDATRLVGVPLSRVNAFVWASGAAVSALGALLIVPTIGVFAPGFASVLFLKGLAGAVFGGLTSLQGAFVGGVAVGVIEAGTKRALVHVSGVPGIDLLVVLGIVLLVLLVRPTGLLAELRTREA